jgi:2-C-methyl-D-erythritol 4-phosphate cytidylyltransferase
VLLNNSVSVIIPAGGSGKRMGTDISKQYLLLNGKPIIDHTIEIFDSHLLVKEIVVVVPEQDVNIESKRLCEKFKKVSKVVCGGNERIDSVRNGLSVLSKETYIVLVHDAVRPFVRHSDIDAVSAELEKCDACTVAVPVKDTVKLVETENIITSTPDRKKLWLTLTPQGFRREVLDSLLCYALENNINGTDECMVAEQMGLKVHVVTGNYSNIKITTKEDLVFADAIVKISRL